MHTQDGIIESPTQRTYTLGDFFDMWRQPLTPTQIASAKGTLTSFVNGHAYNGNLRNIRLGSHVDIQIGVGSPVVAPKKLDWPATQL